MNSSRSKPLAAEYSKIKRFMGRTPGIAILKSKFLTVLGNSNELFNDISNKLTLSISSSISDYTDDEEDMPKFDDTIDYTKIDFESRRVKSRRAHEEIISGRFRHPNLAPRPHSKNRRKVANSSKNTSTTSSISSTTSSSSCFCAHNDINQSEISSTTRSNSSESRHSGGYGHNGHAIAGARRSDLDMEKDLMKINNLVKTNTETPYIDTLTPSDIEVPNQYKRNGHMKKEGNTMVAATSINFIRVPLRNKVSNNSTPTSLRNDGEEQVSQSLESSDWRNFIRSESQNSVPSWASSISLDCRADEEPIKKFMKTFIDVLFNNGTAIDLDLKSEFGTLVRLEIGRQWFTRFLLEQRVKSKRVDDMSFDLLIQFLAIFLFECEESEDYNAAEAIMNMCFLFYHEIDVPGCEPYREYLFTFMRQQSIWHTLHFWNPAFLIAIQNEREHRIHLGSKHLEKQCKRKEYETKSEAISKAKACFVPPATINVSAQTKSDIDGSSSSSSSHRHELMFALQSAKGHPLKIDSKKEDKEEEKVLFQQLCNFTCNMHSLGISEKLCHEFLNKQAINLNFSKDKIKLVKDNVHRMYRETDQWGSNGH